MRILAAAAATLLALTLATTATAEPPPEPEPEPEPLELPTALNNVLAGFNGLLTAPADPVMSFIDPPSELEGLPGAPETAHFVGFFQGIVMVPYRTVMGALDIAFAPLWVFPTLSPEPRFDLVPGYEIEYE
jgi:hypothetical protein